MLQKAESGRRREVMGAVMDEESQVGDAEEGGREGRKGMASGCC